jgi:23S rRNA (cytidine1920-2'-O)/16S rRNA (cytidine1409-2'-O)-methyltransferase
VSARARLDTELVRRGIVGTRAAAQRAIQDGQVMVGGLPAGRPATLVSAETPITLAAAASRFVSRGGDKLDGALDRLDVTVEGRRWLDAGASTGGFTDCLLQRGAAEVVGVDVGYGQLDWKLRTDARVHVIERTNVRGLVPGELPWAPDAAVADLSFISLGTVMPALARAVPGRDADFVLLVKPQFEAGKEAVGRGGVVRDPATWKEALEGVVAAAAAEGLGLVDAVPSHLPGPAGNREFFLHLRRDADEHERRGAPGHLRRDADDRGAGAVERAIQEVS